MDESTLRVTTKAPYAPMINTLGYHWIVVYSEAQIKKIGDDNVHTAPIGSGPFKFVHHKRGQEVRLEANEQYWAGKPKLKTVISRPYPDASARMLALESGDVDLIFQVLPQEAARLAKNPNLVVHTPPSARVIWIYLNTQREPFKDKRVRQALYYAIDREAIVKSLFAGTATRLHSPGPAGSYGYTEAYDRYAYDPGEGQAPAPRGGPAESHLQRASHPGPLSPERAGPRGDPGLPAPGGGDHAGGGSRVGHAVAAGRPARGQEPDPGRLLRVALRQRRHRQRHPGLRLAVLAARRQQHLVLQERRVRPAPQPGAEHPRSPRSGSRRCTGCRRS